MVPIVVPAGKGPTWQERHRRDLQDLVALGVSLLVVGRITGDMPLPAALCALVTAGLVPLRSLKGPPTLWRLALSALPRQAAAVVTTFLLLTFLMPHPLTCLWFGAVWPVAAGLLHVDWTAWAHRLSHGWNQRILPRVGPIVRLKDSKVFGWISRKTGLTRPGRQELLRIAVLLGAALWLMRGIERPTRHGGADSLWYGLNLADAVAQARAGVFPVFVGQSIYQFNGALCPIRIAPLFHYLGILLDLLTFRQLGTFALQNLLLTLLGIAGMASAYLGLRALMPDRKWLAAGLAALFLSSPGVLGIAYNTDLYMTWTTLPLVPIAWYATVRSFQNKGAPGTLILLGTSLGLCWWGHSPIALWSTFLAAAAQAIRLATERGRPIRWGAVLAGALAFGAVAAYPVGSVLFFPAEPRAHVNLFQHASPRTVAYFLEQVFPGVVLPLSAIGRSLSDFQLGYALWAVLLVLVGVQRRSFKPISLVPLAAAGFLILLLLPIPGLDLAVWSFVPGSVRDVTGNWAMSRLYLPMAAATVFAAAAGVSTGLWDVPERRRALARVVAVGCVWSFSEAAKFSAGSRQLAEPPESAVDLLRPENIQISRYSYTMMPDFPTHPSTFTHGVTDPELENHLLKADLETPVAANTQAALAAGTAEASGAFRWELDNGLYNHATLDRTLLMEPGKSYLLKFDFADPGHIHGVLQISGKHFLREYGLPDHGGPRSFGAGGNHADTLPLWSTSGPEVLTVRFFPTSPIPEDQTSTAVARATLLSYDRESLPVRVVSWIPYRATIKSPAPAWLETPRVFQTGYRAWVGDMPARVQKSKDSLVAVEVPQGTSSVRLIYEAPAGLRVLFWLSFGSILGLAALGALKTLRHPAGPSRLS